MKMVTGHWRHRISSGCQFLVCHWPYKAYSLCVIHHTVECWYHLLSWPLLFGCFGGSRMLWLANTFQQGQKQIHITAEVCQKYKKATFRNLVVTLSGAQSITMYCGFLSLLLDGGVTGHILILASLFWWPYERWVIAYADWFGILPGMSVKSTALRSRSEVK